MMKFFLHSRSETDYASVVWHRSSYLNHVTFAVRRPSLAQRIELTAKLRELMLNHEFLRSGDTQDRVDASLSELLVRRLYIEWGLAVIKGLKIDGGDACPISLIDHGPEELADEIIGVIKTGSGLTDDERKNS